MKKNHLIFPQIQSRTSPETEILAVGGSPRKNGNSDILMKQVLSGVSEEDVECRSVFLRDILFQGCVGCERCRKDKICTGLMDGMSLVYREIIRSKGLVLVSPTHHYNITAWMKAFIDRLYCFYNFQDTRPRAWSSQLANQGRKAVILAICEQEGEEDMGFTLEAMKRPIEALGYEVVGYEVVGEQAVFSVFDRGNVKLNDRVMNEALKLGKTLSKAIL